MRTFDWRHRVGTLGFLVTLVLFTVQIPVFARGGWGNLSTVLLQHIWVLGILLVLSWPTRTVPVRTLVVFFFLGVYAVAVTAQLLGWPLLWLTKELSVVGLGRNLLIPAMEELLKVVPVLLYFGLGRRERLQPAAIDGLLLGFAVGAGFAFHEDMVASRSVGHGWHLTPLGLLLPTAAKIGGGFMGPSLRWIAGHAGWTALAGLSVGLCALYRSRRAGWLRTWRVAIAGFGLVLLDHASVNYSGPGDAFVDRLLLRGQLVPVVLGFAIAVVLLVEWILLRDSRLVADYFPSIPRSKQLALLPPRSLRRLLELRVVRSYQRLRRAAYLTLWRWRREPPEREAGRDVLGEVARFGVAAGAWVPTSGETRRSVDL